MLMRSEIPPLILVVEDECDLRRMLCRLLLEEGYRVLQAASGLSALTVAAQHLDEIDLVLTDIRMPEMGGCELARELRRRRPQIRVVYTSGYTDQELEPGATLLRKPFSPAILRQAVRTALDPGSLAA